MTRKCIAAFVSSWPIATHGAFAMLVFAVRAGDGVHAAMAALLIIFFGWLSAYCWSPRRTADDLGNDW